MQNKSTELNEGKSAQQCCTRECYDVQCPKHQDKDVPFAYCDGSECKHREEIKTEAKYGDM